MCKYAASTTQAGTLRQHSLRTLYYSPPQVLESQLSTAVELGAHDEPVRAGVGGVAESY